MEAYKQEEYDFIEDDEFQRFLKSRLNGKFVPLNKFMSILNSCKREYIRYLNNKHLYRNTPLY